MRRWQQVTEWPMMLAAVAFLAAYAWPILDPTLSSSWQRTCSVVVWVTWAMCVVDYVAQLLLAEDRWAYVRRHVLDLAVVVLPLLRPLRLLRLVRLLQVVNQRAAASLRGRVATYVVGGAALLAAVSSLAMLDAERTAKGASITSYGDALWWSITTMTTVGYGDTYPVTVTGRCIAAALMICGIALLGVVTATLASWLLDSVADVTEKESDKIDDLREEIRALREQVERLAGARSEEPSDVA